MNAVTVQSFADLLRRYRRAAGFTQEQLADRTGLSVRGICDLERGARRIPHRETIRLLAGALALAPHEVAQLEAAVVRLRGAGSRPPTPSLPRFEPAAGAALPAPLTSFVGREAEVVAAVHLLRRSDVRLLTLLGPAGVGKTRLALRVAEVVTADFRDGVAFVALTALVDPALVLPTIAHALDITDIRGRPLLAVLSTTLRERHLLLLLDNFEQVAAAGPDLVALLQACPKLVGLVTSRAALSVQGEQQLAVPPLPVPPPQDMHEDREDREGSETNGEVVASTVAQYPAVRLLIERAQAVRPDFAPAPTTLPALVETCRRLDGLPLAIELAAPQLKLLSPHDLLARLERRLPPLTVDARSGPTRHRTLHAAITWSYDLLAPAERVLFRRLAVFAGGCTLEAAESVCGVSGDTGDITVEAVFDGVASLLDKSLLYVTTAAMTARTPASPPHVETDGERRIGMLETVRGYALELLEASGEAEDVRARHAAFYLALVEEAEAEAQQQGPEQQRWLDRLEAELANLRAAFEWALARRDTELALRVSAALHPYWGALGRQREGRALVERALAVAAGTATAATRARALGAAGWMVLLQGDYPGAAHFFQRAVARWREAGNSSELAVAIADLGFVATVCQLDDVPLPALLDEASALRTEVTDRRAVAHLQMLFGLAAAGRSDWATAAALLDEALDLYRAIHDVVGLTICLSCLGLLVLGGGEHARAEALLREDLDLSWHTGDVMGAQLALVGLGCLCAAAAKATQAVRLWGAAEKTRELAGLQMTPMAVSRTNYEGYLADARAQLGPAAFAEAWARGRALSLEEAVAEALGEAKR